MSSVPPLPVFSPEGRILNVPHHMGSTPLVVAVALAALALAACAAWYCTRRTVGPLPDDTHQPDVAQGALRAFAITDREAREAALCACILPVGYPDPSHLQVRWESRTVYIYVSGLCTDAAQSEQLLRRCTNAIHALLRTPPDSPSSFQDIQINMQPSYALSVRDALGRGLGLSMFHMSTCDVEESEVSQRLPGIYTDPRNFANDKVAWNHIIVQR